MSLTVNCEPHPSCCYFISNSRQVSIKFLIGSVVLPGNIQGHLQHASIASISLLRRNKPFLTYNSYFIICVFIAIWFIAWQHMVTALTPSVSLKLLCLQKRAARALLSVDFNVPSTSLFS